MVSPVYNHIHRHRPCVLSLYASTHLGNARSNIQQYIFPTTLAPANVALNWKSEIDYDAGTVRV